MTTRERRTLEAGQRICKRAGAQIAVGCKPGCCTLGRAALLSAGSGATPALCGATPALCDAEICYDDSTGPAACDSGEAVVGRSDRGERMFWERWGKRKGRLVVVQRCQVRKRCGILCPDWPRCGRFFLSCIVTLPARVYPIF